MIDLAKYIYTLYNGAPLSKGWKVNLAITNERKYDFIREGGRRQLPEPRELLVDANFSKPKATVKNEK